jgi:hypothetical protein
MNDRTNRATGNPDDAHSLPGAVATATIGDGTESARFDSVRKKPLDSSTCKGLDVKKLII